MTDYINHFNHTNYSQNYIHRLMKVIKVHARIRRKKSNYKKVKPEQVGENILARDSKADYPNQKWCTDVTEFKVPGQKQKLYLSAIIAKRKWASTSSLHFSFGFSQRNWCSSQP